MTLDEFIKQHSGKYLEVAGSPGAENQCVDLANGYIRDVLRLPIIEWTNAKDFPSKAGSAYSWIPNTPEAIIQKGDIPVWRGNVAGITGSAGHIAVAVSGDINRFTSFDQNFPTGSPCKLVTHTYTGVTGWLRAKAGGGDGSMTYKGYDLSNAESMKVAVDVLVRVQAGEFVDKPLHEETVRNLNESIASKDREITELQAQKKTVEAERDEAKRQVKTYKTDALKLPAVMQELSDTKESRQGYIDENVMLSKAIEERDAELKRLEDDALALLIRKIMRVIRGGEQRG